MDIITIHNLKKYYGSGSSQVKALDGVDLTIAQGTFTAIVGASGSGKTTLLNMIGGLDTPTAGEVIVDGVRLSGLREEQRAVFRRKKAGFIFQNYNLLPTLTVEENILFPLDLDGSKPDKKYFEEIMELLGLTDKMQDYPGMLSGGQQQRAAIARALMTKPSIILADEPTGNLDSQNGQNVAGLLKMTTELYHRTLVLITHNLELAQLADRVIRMQDGRISEGAKQCCRTTI
ncbi:MAG: ABC transporter ATP-binding protein [Lachnospiraceae bacterium]